MHLVTKSRLQDFNFTFFVAPTGKKINVHKFAITFPTVQVRIFPILPFKDIIFAIFTFLSLFSLSLVPFMNTLSFCSLTYSLIIHSSRDLEDPKGILIICQWWSFSINSSNSNITFYRFFFKFFYFISSVILFPLFGFRENKKDMHSPLSRVFLHVFQMGFYLKVQCWSFFVNSFCVFFINYF